MENNAVITEENIKKIERIEGEEDKNLKIEVAVREKQVKTGKP